MSSTKSGSRDFSLFSLFAAGLACLVPLASAYTQPVGSAPVGNPFSEPGLHSIVPVGKNFTVTWQPTTQGTVTLVLLKGPSSDAVPQYPIAQHIPNSGTFVWEPSTDLQPGDTGYGLQLICDSNGQYQYTTQFGISNPDFHSGSSQSESTQPSEPASYPTPSSESTKSSEPTVETTAPAESTTSSEQTVEPTAPAESTMSSEQTVEPTTHTSAPATTEIVKSYTTFCPFATSFTMNNKTYTAHSATTIVITDCPCTVTKSRPSASAPASSGMPHNITVIAPTGPMTVPSSLKTSATVAPVSASPSAAFSSTPFPAGTNGAASLTGSFIGLVIAAAAAVFAL